MRRDRSPPIVGAEFDDAAGAPAARLGRDDRADRPRRILFGRGVRFCPSCRRRSWRFSLGRVGLVLLGLLLVSCCRRPLIGESARGCSGGRRRQASRSRSSASCAANRATCRSRGRLCFVAQQAELILFLRMMAISGASANASSRPYASQSAIPSPSHDRGRGRDRSAFGSALRGLGARTLDRSLRRFSSERRLLPNRSSKKPPRLIVGIAAAVAEKLRLGGIRERNRSRPRWRLGRGQNDRPANQ